MENFDTINSSISLVNKCLENNNDSAYANVADTYLPIGPNNRDNKIDWERVYQVLVEKLFQLSLGERDKEKLRSEVLEAIRSTRDTRELASVIDELYFSSNEVKNITPLAYLVSNQDKLSARTKTMISIVGGLINTPINKKYNYIGNNPLETLLIENVYLLCKKTTISENWATYLPFLADVFTRDLEILANNPSYLLSELERFIKIYTFLYLSQLTIQVCIPANRYNTPTAKPLYFILETEAASRERHECNQFGYDYIFSKTKGIAYNLFPILGYFNRISKNPIWSIPHDESDECVSKVNEFNCQLALLFGENYQYDESFHMALNKGIAFHQQIFEESLKNSKKGSRKGRNKVVVDIFEENFSAGFISNRKAAGKYFVLNSSVLILLTNIIIKGSNNNKLLIDDIIEGFNGRGVWLDLKSKKALLKFYESVGNIEKLSDSGDAVYVKATI